MTRPFILDQRAILRSHRLSQMNAALDQWGTTTGSEHAWWREEARYRLREFRRLHLIPERAAFETAVSRNKARRRIAA